MQFKQKTPIKEGENEIQMPAIQYHKVATIESQQVFTGSITPIPSVLIEYLDKTELKVFSIVLKHQRENGVCYVRLPTIAAQLKMTPTSIFNATSRMKSMGILKYENKGRRRNKMINFQAIQALNDLLLELKPGATINLRQKIKNKNVENITASIQTYLNDNFGYTGDPIEDEEYD